MIAITVARGSAIIGPPPGDELAVTVDYEGAVYGQANMKTLADRARQAAGRQMAHYPTVAATPFPEASCVRWVGSIQLMVFFSSTTRREQWPHGLEWMRSIRRNCISVTLCPDGV